MEADPADHALEFLSENGGAYISAETRALACALGLKPINTPVCSSQSNGMAESFVNTFKCDYMARFSSRYRALPASHPLHTLRGDLQNSVSFFFSGSFSTLCGSGLINTVA